MCRTTATPKPRCLSAPTTSLTPPTRSSLANCSAFALAGATPPPASLSHLPIHRVYASTISLTSARNNPPAFPILQRAGGRRACKADAELTRKRLTIVRPVVGQTAPLSEDRRNFQPGFAR